MHILLSRRNLIRRKLKSSFIMMGSFGRFTYKRVYRYIQSWSWRKGRQGKREEAKRKQQNIGNGERSNGEYVIFFCAE